MGIRIALRVATRASGILMKSTATAEMVMSPPGSRPMQAGLRAAARLAAGGFHHQDLCCVSALPTTRN